MMNEKISIPREGFQRILMSIEYYCVNSCPMFKNACLHFECPLFAIEHLLMEHHEEEGVDEPLCWYLIHFNCIHEFALVRTTNDKAESIADQFGETYDLHVYGSFEDACEDMRTIMKKKF